jgi:hypothetical protein
MVSLVLGMLLCVAIALVVMALVAVPARRAGREVLTERGEEFLGSIRDRQPLPGRSTASDGASATSDGPGTARSDEPVRASA